MGWSSVTRILADRRSTLIGMTDAGRTLFARMAPAHAQWIEQAMAGLDRRDVAQLWEVLGHLKESVRGSHRCPGRTVIPAEKAALAHFRRE